MQKLQTRNRVAKELKATEDRLATFKLEAAELKYEIAEIEALLLRKKKQYSDLSGGWGGCEISRATEKIKHLAQRLQCFDYPLAIGVDGLFAVIRVTPKRIYTVTADGAKFVWPCHRLQELDEAATREAFAQWIADGKPVRDS
jgi:hypothetical protein